MQPHLLMTKLVMPPARPDRVHRARLVERLTAAADRKLTVLTAPAGFGKTTLLSAWVAQRPTPVSWVTLDADDNDAVRFWSAAIAVLQQRHPSLGSTALELLMAVPPLPSATILTVLLNALAELPERAILVLDDYHVIAADPIHQALAYFVDHLPGQVQLIIASRSDPSLPLARWRARSQLAEVRAADLRFTPDEAATFLTEVMHLPLAPADVQTLAARTEGWIAGLQLAALALQGRRDVGAFLQAFTGRHRYVLHYLVDEVLGQLAPERQAFLLRTAILDRLSGALCDAVVPPAPTGSSQGMLEQLEQANVFTLALDDVGQWYRYHQLFAEALRHRLQQTQPELVPELHRRASAWYEQAGLADEAIQHALAAGEHARAARLVEPLVKRVIGRGHLTTLRQWLEALPDGEVRARPRLSLGAAWMLLALGQTDLAAAWVGAAEAALVRMPPPGLPAGEHGHLVGEVATVHALLALLQADYPQAIARCQEAVQYADAQDLFVQGLIAYNLGNAYQMSGDTTAATAALDRAARIGEQAGNVLLVLYAQAVRAAIYEVEGRLRSAARIQQDALRLAATEDGPLLPLAGLAYVGLGKLYREWNELDAATWSLGEGIALGRQGELDGITLDGTMTLALVEHARGAHARARDLLAQAAAVARGVNEPAALARIAAFGARVDLAAGELAAAVHWAEHSGLQADDALSEPREIEHLTLARVRLAQGRAEPDAGYLAQTAALLGRLEQATTASGRLSRLIDVWVLQALTQAAQGDRTGAHTRLTRALRQAESEGFVRTFLDEGAPLIALLRELVRDRAMGGYATRLLEQASGAPPAAAITLGGGSELVEPLSEREREVLGLIAAGLKNQDIATQLVVVVGTVKAHIHSIYGKLDVANRVQAVARARELGLL